MVRNRTANLLTRLVDLEIVTGSLIMRRSRSVLGAVAPTSGAFSIYRAAVYYDNVADYLASGTYSDDRRLTHYALMRGQVVVVDEAIVETEMPTTIRTTFRQRTRWFQGHFKYLPWELSHLTGWPYLLRLWNLVLLVAYPVVFVIVFVLTPIISGYFYWEALVYWLALMYVQTTYYVVERRRVPLRERMGTWLLLTPLLIFLQFVVLRPAMYYASTRTGSSAWVTRG